ncbi:hypothetical protein LDENG_00027180 [Lucifuga dentata]|nr:hypothetical protein LDENG_00027180 [Lucifuga dentata]
MTNWILVLVLVSVLFCTLTFAAPHHLLATDESCEHDQTKLEEELEMIRFLIFNLTDVPDDNIMCILKRIQDCEHNLTETLTEYAKEYETCLTLTVYVTSNCTCPHTPRDDFDKLMQSERLLLALRKHITSSK